VYVAAVAIIGVEGNSRRCHEILRAVSVADPDIDMLVEV